MLEILENLHLHKTIHLVATHIKYMFPSALAGNKTTTKLAYSFRVCGTKRGLTVA